MIRDKIPELLCGGRSHKWYVDTTGVVWHVQEINTQLTQIWRVFVTEVKLPRLIQLVSFRENNVEISSNYYSSLLVRDNILKFCSNLSVQINYSPLDVISQLPWKLF